MITIDQVQNHLGSYYIVEIEELEKYPELGKIFKLLNKDKTKHVAFPLDKLFEMNFDDFINHILKPAKNALDSHKVN